MNSQVPNTPKRTLSAKTVTLAHGSGGKAMRDLIEVVFVEGFKNDLLAPLEDPADAKQIDWFDADVEYIEE